MTSDHLEMYDGGEPMSYIGHREAWGQSIPFGGFVGADGWLGPWQSPAISPVISKSRWA